MCTKGETLAHKSIKLPERESLFDLSGELHLSWFCSCPPRCMAEMSIFTRNALTALSYFLWSLAWSWWLSSKFCQSLSGETRSSLIYLSHNSQEQCTFGEGCFLQTGNYLVFCRVIHGPWKSLLASRRWAGNCSEHSARCSPMSTLKRLGKPLALSREAEDDHKFLSCCTETPWSFPVPYCSFFCIGSFKHFLAIAHYRAARLSEEVPR